MLKPKVALKTVTIKLQSASTPLSLAMLCVLPFQQPRLDPTHGHSHGSPWSRNGKVTTS